MSVTEPAVRLSLVAVPAIPPATLAWWQTPAIDLFGANIPIASMVLSLLGLAMARGVSSAREGASPGGWYVTATLALILIGIVIERQPTAGIAVAWGVGIGSSGILLIDLFKGWVLDKIKRFQGPSSVDQQAREMLKGMDKEQ